MMTKARFLILMILLLLSANFSFSQTTEFTYQGRLLDNSLPPTAAYDFEFRLFSVQTNGAPLAAQQRLGVAVVNGIFTVRLDFAGNFDGSPRWLEIAVKPAGSPNPFQVLSPRQPFTSAPYSIRSLNAGSADTAVNSLQLGGVAANQFVQTSDARLSDDRNPLPGSTSYIQNTNSQQTSSNFNISGSGTANIFNAATQFNLGGNRILIADATNFFVGVNTGTANTSGSFNSFIGRFAGTANTTGNSNTFVGYFTGANNSTGSGNSFFGGTSGNANTTGANNSFYGVNAGNRNTTANNNSIFGANAGVNNLIGTDNAFFGFFAGNVNTTSFNSFFGSLAGAVNTNGSGNAFFGYKSGNANVTGLNNAFFGYQSGLVNTSSNNTFFGSQAGSANTSGGFNTFIGTFAGNTNTTGNRNTIIGYGADVASPDLIFSTAIGAGAIVTTSHTIVIGTSNETVEINGPSSFESPITFSGVTGGGSISLCLTNNAVVAQCSSSLRYKSGIQTFTGGLDIVRRLRPISFDWKEGGRRDVGFAAEEVGEIEPLLATYNKDGQIEGVKYGQITTVLVNAVKEQQSQIEQLQKQIEALKIIVCAEKPDAALCKEK
jgi:hypothetical protein